MSELEEKIERIEKLLLLTWKLVKAVKRGHNRVTRTFNGNFDVFDDNINRNAKNIDKIVNTLQGLMGEDGIKIDDTTEGKVREIPKSMYL